MRVVQHIDRALKEIYHLETTHCAEHFLINSTPEAFQQVSAKNLHGALLIRNSSPNEASQEINLDLGIYLSQEVQEKLARFTEWSQPWSNPQMNAFAVVAEEISHFHCLLFNLERRRPVTEFELELQGEIDKFLLLYLSDSVEGPFSVVKFDALFEQLFVSFRLAEGLTETQKQRYLDASRFAQKFFLKFKKELVSLRAFEKWLKKLRAFYQSDLVGKMAFLSG